MECGLYNTKWNNNESGLKQVGEIKAPTLHVYYVCRYVCNREKGKREKRKGSGLCEREREREREREANLGCVACYGSSECSPISVSHSHTVHRHSQTLLTSCLPLLPQSPAAPICSSINSMYTSTICDTIIMHGVKCFSLYCSCIYILQTSK